MTADPGDPPIERPIFTASYADFKLIKTRGVVQFVFEVDISQADHAYRILGGLPTYAKERVVAIARLDQDEIESRTLNLQAREVKREEKILTALDTHEPPPAKDPPDKEPTTEKAPRRLTMSQRAALVCKEALFHRFVEKKTLMAPVDEEGAIDYMRMYCGVDSRSKIKTDTEAGILFEQLMNEFAAWKLA